MSDPRPEGISVNLLVKNCASQLKDCLASLEDFLRPDLGDELVIVDTGSTDHGETRKVCNKHGARVYDHPELASKGMLELVRKYVPEKAELLEKEPQFSDGFISDFAKARQVCQDYSKNRLIFWLDSDDILVGAKALRDLAAKAFSEMGARCLFMAYDYSHDDDGKCNTVLWRERIVPRDEFHWKGCCHESLIPNDGQPVAPHKVPPELSRLVHKHAREHTFSDLRNYAILREAYDTAVWKDPRWEFYLGNACRGLMRVKEAIDWYCRTLVHSGNPEDRLSASLNIGLAYLLFGRPWKAIDWFFQAIKILPGDPRAYFGVAQAYFRLRNWPEVLRWSQIGYDQGKPDVITSIDPNQLDFFPKVYEALALKELNQPEAAFACAKEALSCRPTYGAARDLIVDLQRWTQTEAIKRSVNTVAQIAYSPEAAVKILHSLKPEIRRAIPDLQIETVATPPKKSVTFFCGGAPEPWDASCVETGIGGSEKMVILLARELARRGYRVDVYGAPKNAYKQYDGVTYLPFQAFNPLLPRDTVICWRNWGYIDTRMKANRIFMDLHDVQDPSYYSPQRLSKIKAAVFKSQFHLAPVKDVVGGKGIVLRNALDPTHFTAKPERDRYRLVYCSSADRGLKRTLRLFRKIQRAQPKASLHIYYGFTSMYFDKAARFPYQPFGEEGCERHMLDYAEECFQLIDQLGAKHHGRVGHKAIAEELASSSVLLYPTLFPEISCMAAFEAQAAGCIPVVSRFGALEETVQYGVLCDPSDDDDFVRAVLGVFDKGADFDTYRAEMSAAALKNFDIATLADQWIDLIEKTP